MRTRRPLAGGEELETRLLALDGVSARRMFGGMAFMLHGRMFAAALPSFVMFLLDEYGRARCLADEPSVRPAQIAGRPFGRWLQWDLDTFDAGRVSPWLEIAYEYIRSLPATPPARRGQGRPLRV